MHYRCRFTRSQGLDVVEHRCQTLRSNQRWTEMRFWLQGDGRRRTGAGRDSALTGSVGLKYLFDTNKQLEPFIVRLRHRHCEPVCAVCSRC